LSALADAAPAVEVLLTEPTVFTAPHGALTWSSSLLAGAFGAYLGEQAGAPPHGAVRAGHQHYR